MNIVQCLHVQKKYKKTRRMFLKDLELLALQFCRKQFDLIDCFLKKKIFCSYLNIENSIQTI